MPGSRRTGRGPFPTILNEMNPEGYWVKAGPGYGPKYYSTVWSLILLGQLGASIECLTRASSAPASTCASTR